MSRDRSARPGAETPLLGPGHLWWELQNSNPRPQLCETLSGPFRHLGLSGDAQMAKSIDHCCVMWLPLPAASRTERIRKQVSVARISSLLSGPPHAFPGSVTL